MTLLSRLWPRRLAGQLNLVVAGVLCSALAAFGLHTVRDQTALAQASIAQQAAGLARGVALASQNPILTDKLDLIEELALHSAQGAEVLSLVVLDPQGVPLVQVARDADAAPTARFAPPDTRWPVPAEPLPQLQTDEAGARVVAWHPVVAGRLLGWVKVAHSTRLLAELRSRILRSSAIAALLAGLAGVLAVTLLMRRPLYAIRRASELAVRLDNVDGEQISVIDGPDDTRQLSLALNQASDRLLAQHQTIQTHLATLRAQEQVLADAHDRLSAIFALSPDGLLSLDGQDRVRFANPAFCRLTGLSAEQLQQATAAQVDAHLRQCADPAQAYPGLGRLLAPPALEAEPGGAARPARQRLTLKRPRHTVLEVAGLQGEGPALHWLLYLRDITHEDEVDRLKTEFLSVAAHELRTPMTSIHAGLELMALYGHDAARQARLLAMMQRQSALMVTLINGLLDLARIEAGEDTALQLEPCALAEVAGQAGVDFVVPAGRAAPVWQQAGVQAMVLADRQRLVQVLSNLLSNAYKYSESGSVQLRLLPPRPRSPGAPLEVGVAVQDQGIGMSPEQLARVGERFYRADASGHVPGTGLGVSIVRELLQRMGGRLALDSRLGQGTTATLWLPCLPETAATPQAGPEPAGGAGSDPAAGTRPAAVTAGQR